MYILIHHSEIGLKGKNRTFFEQKLIQNCLTALKPFSAHAKRLSGRILLEITDRGKHDSTIWTAVKNGISKVFGIANFAPVYQWKGSNLQDLGVKIRETLFDSGYELQASSFKIATSRADKTYPLTSHEVNEKLGALLQKSLRKRVDLEHPDLTVFIEILPKGSILYYFEKIKGAGGLPTTSAGNIVSLLSGGIDSPVASWQLMKRGAKVIFLHFHSYPYTNKASQTIVKDIMRVLAPWQQGALLYLASLADIQGKIIAVTPPKLRLLLYRRAMVKIASILAIKLGAKALVTGESLGQVASQTLENIVVIAEASNLPIFRPLIGHDKEEIITMAKRIKTYDISTRPYEDCCSFLVPKHPETRAKLEEVKAEEKRLSLKDLLQKSLQETKVITS